MNHRQLDKQFLRIALSQLMGFIVPFTTFQIHTVAVNTVGWFFLNVGRLHVISDDKLEAKCINSNLSGARAVLHSAGQESLWEEET